GGAACGGQGARGGGEEGLAEGAVEADGLVGMKGARRGLPVGGAGEAEPELAADHRAGEERARGQLLGVDLRAERLVFGGEARGEALEERGPGGAAVQGGRPRQARRRGGQPGERRPARRGA